MSSFFIYESNNKFEMYKYGLYKWIDIVKIAKANKIIYSLGAAFVVLTVLIFVYLDIFPEWLKGCAILFETLSAIFLIPALFEGGEILIKDNDVKPEKVLASRDLYFLRKCGRLTDGFVLCNVYYIQWEGGRGIIIDDTGLSLYGIGDFVPYGSSERAKDSTLVVRKNKIKKEFPVDIINSDMILDIVKESGIMDCIAAGVIKKEKIGRKILQKISKEC